jgi:low temperature requirement protein LtrA
MTGRSPEEAHRVATPLELFFDLVFVIALARAAEVLHHAVADGHAAAGVQLFAMSFFAIWWAWMNFTWFASAYDCDDVPYRLLAFVQMTGALVLSAGVGEAFAAGDFRIAFAGYLIMRLAMVGQWLRAARQDPGHRRTALRYAVGIVVVQAAWAMMFLVPPEQRPLAFLGFAVAEMAVPAWAERSGRTTWHPHHIAERYGLFTIIVLGESVLAASMAIQAITSTDGLSVPLARVILGGLLTIFAMWWLYFDGAFAGHLNGGYRGAFIFGYGHFVVLGTAAMVGPGLAVLADQAAQHAGISRTGAGLALGIPAALFLCSLWVMHWLNDEQGPTRWWAPIAALLVLGAAMSPWPALGVGGVLAGLVATKLLFHRLRTAA